MSLPPCFSDKEARKVIRELCKNHDITEILLKNLCETFNEYAGSGRREGIISDFNAVFDRFLLQDESTNTAEDA